MHHVHTYASGAVGIAMALLVALAALPAVSSISHTEPDERIQTFFVHADTRSPVVLGETIAGPGTVHMGWFGMVRLGEDTEIRIDDVEIDPDTEGLISADVDLITGSAWVASFTVDSHIAVTAGEGSAVFGGSAGTIMYDGTESTIYSTSGATEIRYADTTIATLGTRESLSLTPDAYSALANQTDTFAQRRMAQRTVEPMSRSAYEALRTDMNATSLQLTRALQYLHGESSSLLAADLRDILSVIPAARDRVAADYRSLIAQGETDPLHSAATEDIAPLVPFTRLAPLAFAPAYTNAAIIDLHTLERDMLTHMRIAPLDTADRAYRATLAAQHGKGHARSALQILQSAPDATHAKASVILRDTLVAEPDTDMLGMLADMYLIDTDVAEQHLVSLVRMAGGYIAQGYGAAAESVLIAATNLVEDHAMVHTLPTLAEVERRVAFVQTRPMGTPFEEATYADWVSSMHASGDSRIVQMMIEAEIMAQEETHTAEDTASTVREDGKTKEEAQDSEITEEPLVDDATKEEAASAPVRRTPRPRSA